MIMRVVQRMAVAISVVAACGDPFEAGDSESTDPSAADTGTTPDGVVGNPGFEDDAVADGQFNPSITPARWQRYDPAGILNGNDNVVGILNPTGTSLYPDGAPEGRNVALVFLWNTDNDGNPTGLSQRLTTTELAAGSTYTLRVQVGNIAAADGAPYDLSGFPGYRVELLAGGEVLVADDDTLSPDDGKFEQSEISYTATASDAAIGQPLEIRLINLNVPESGIEVNFDDVELVVE
jgi:hypothetical protein